VRHEGVSRPEPSQIPAEPVQPAMDAGQPPAVRHNHVTRDIKPRGACPACDRYWPVTDERNVGMELMDAWNAAHRDGDVAMMAVMGHQDLAGYRFVIQVNGADYQVTVRELDGPA